MAAPTDVPSHHVRGEECSTRPAYREGRRQKAVKVYTVNLESNYLLVQGVPSVGVIQELIKLFALYGAVAEYRILDEYPTADQFTDVILIKFEKIQAARIARRKLDDWSFYGGILHVCYAPEHESVEETRLKLQDRRKSIAARIRKNEAERSKPKVNNSITVQSQSVVSGQSSSLQGQRSTSQRSADEKQFDRKSFQDNRSSNMGTHIRKPNTKETQKSGDRISQPNTRVPPLPNTTGEPAVEEEQQIWIPPPPKEMANRDRIFHHSISNYEFARVPTAHSVYPSNYDARISAKSDDTQSYNHNTYIQRKRDENPAGKSKSFPQNNGDFKEIFLQRNLSKGDNSIINRDTDQMANTNSEVKLQTGVIVRAFKPQTAPPKFVPRQMMNLSKKTVNSSINTSKDEMNKELRQNALKLGEIQGPVAQGQDSVREPRKPTEVEESLEKTRTQIRKRVSEITSEEKSIAKKAKSS